MGEVACAGANRVVALKADGFKVEKLRVGDWRPWDLVGDEVHADYLKVKVRDARIVAPVDWIIARRLCGSQGHACFFGCVRCYM